MAVSNDTIRLYTVAALSTPTIGPGTVRSWYLDGIRFGRAHAVEILISETNRLALEKHVGSLMDAQIELDRLDAVKGWCRSIFDSDYPALLKSIPEAPAVIYGLGNPAILDSAFVAVVGTRKPSLVGTLFTKDFVQFLAHEGVGIASGLALGIDTIAHTAALDSHGRTLAVLPSGLDIITPTSNTSLARRILAAEGAIVTEHPLGTMARKAEFVRRNRIISGLSIASVLCECAPEGGSIHQARYTAIQKRPLFTFVPDTRWPHVDDFLPGGAEVLIKELGATAIHSRKDYSSVLNAVDSMLDRPPVDGSQLPLI